MVAVVVVATVATTIATTTALVAAGEAGLADATTAVRRVTFLANATDLHQKCATEYVTSRQTANSY